MTISRHSLIWLVIALSAWLLNAALHLEFSNWIVTSYNTPFGKIVPLDYTQGIAVFVCLLLAALLLWQ